MEETPLELLKHDLLDYFDTASKIKQCMEKLALQEANLMARREAAQSTGAAVDDLWKDEEYQRIRAERQVLMPAVRQHLDTPRLDKEQAAELRKQLKPEEKSRLRQEMLHRLQSLPSETKAELAATVEHSLQKTTLEHGMSPDVEASIAKLRKLQDQINQVDEDQ